MSSSANSSNRNSAAQLPECPPGLRFQDWLASWDSSQIDQWLTENRCGSHASLFAAHDITGQVLLDVDQQALKEMGIGSVGERIKIVVAVKKLRQACSLAHAHQQQQQRASSSTSSSTRSGRHPPPPLQLHHHSQAQSGSSGHGHRRGMRDGSSSHQYSGSSSSSAGSASLVPPFAASLSSSVSPGGSRSKSPMPRSGGSSGSSSNVPAPKSSLPPPPTGSNNNNNSSSSSTRSDRPARTTSNSVDLRTQFNQSANTSIGGTAPLRPKVGTWNSQVPALGFPKTSQLSSSQQSERSPNAASLSHRKAASVSPGLPANPRPANAQGGGGSSSSSYGHHHQPLSSHPYATSVSPTLDNFPSSSSSRPSTATGTLSTNSRPSTAGAAPSTASLSPITESHSSSSGLPSPLHSEYPRSIQSTLPHSVLHSQQKPPQPGAGLRSSPGGGPGAQLPPALALEDLLKRAVKFIGDEGEYKMVNVEGSRDATDILARALRKFGKLTQGERGEDDNVAEMDGWAVFGTSSDGSTHVLSDAELYSICTSVNRPERSRGLSLRHLHHSPGQKRRNKALREFFGEDLPPSDTRNTTGLVSPSSPTAAFNTKLEPRSSASNNNITIEPASPEPRSDGSRSPNTRISPATSDGLVSPGSGGGGGGKRGSNKARKSLNRASALSVLSGLDEENALPQQTPTRSSRIRSFFGHRPPSELISNHLADYFPSAEKKLLNKTRSSVRRSLAAKNQPHPLAWETQGGINSRFSVSSTGSNATGLSIDLPPPPLPSKRGLNRRISSYAPKPLNEGQDGVILEDDADVASLASARPKSRASHLSVRSRSSGKDSDSASCLTVDEITAEVEQRRKSLHSSVAGARSCASSNKPDDSDHTTSASEGEDEGRQSGEYSTGNRLPSVALPHEETGMEDDSDEETSNEEDEDDEEEEDEEEEEKEEEQDNSPEKVTSTGSKNQIKWIKGALVGAGSFGQVFLAMNAINGTLMAVKQVEIPSDEENEARKRSMVTALEREIDLLKGLQHPHIVEYLDSSSDGNHLNIFLEYVPGGSVTVLLRNYGAFEEPLVRTFIKQVLQGLNYLHERDIVHRDIKGANILVDNKGSIKISDFGISKKESNLLSGARAQRASLQGSVFWMAPEVVKQTSYTSKADIWSLGCVTIEMLTGDHPYVNLNQMQALFKIGTASGGPDIPSNITPDAHKFLEQTFSIDFTARPSATELLQTPFIASDPTGSQQTPTATTFSL